MPLPEPDKRGFLPEGCHRASWDEIRKAFCISGHRRNLMKEFHRFIETELRPLGSGLSLIIGGSFISDKVTPDDIESSIFIPNAELPTRGGLIGIGSPAEHNRIKDDYGMDFYVTLDLAGHNDFYNFFQYVGPKAARKKKGLNEKDRRGIIEVSPW